MQVNDLVEKWICDTLSSYRMLYLLRDAVNYKSLSLEDKRAVTSALMEEGRKICINQKGNGFTEDMFMLELLRVLPDIEGWLEYSLLDNAFYLEKIFGNVKLHELDKNRMREYMHRMTQQHYLLNWNSFAFKLHSGNCVIYDFGVGEMPYLPQFYENIDTCKSLQYIGIDKVPLYKKFFEWEYEILLTNDALTIEIEKGDMRDFPPKDNLPRPTILFFGESLHCVEKPEEVIRNLMCHYGSTVQKILILEPNLDDNRGVGKAFEYHMLKHCNGKVLNRTKTAKIANSLGMVFSVFYPSSQHTMYCLEKNNG